MAPSARSVRAAGACVKCVCVLLRSCFVNHMLLLAVHHPRCSLARSDAANSPKCTTKEWPALRFPFLVYGRWRPLAKGTALAGPSLFVLRPAQRSGARRAGHQENHGRNSLVFMPICPALVLLFCVCDTTKLFYGHAKVGPWCRRNLIPRRPNSAQNQTGLPAPNPKPTPAWRLGLAVGCGDVALWHYNEKTCLLYVFLHATKTPKWQNFR